MILAEKRVYEVIFIVDPDTQEDELTRLTDNLSGVITDQGGTITRNEVLGRRQLAEMERRMRVNDQVMRYMTVRVDEERQRAEKLRARRARKAAKRPFAAA